MSRTRTSIFTLAAVCLAFGAVSLLSSCRRLSPGEELDSILESRNRPKQVEIDRERRLRQLDTEVKRRFRLVRDLIWSGDFDRAGAILATMDTLTEYREELDKLKELLHLARTMGVNETELALDQQRILNEAANLNSLPGTYGKTVTISPDMEPLKLPEGPLEKMLSQKISLKVNGMKLADLAMKLRELDGVNLADPVNVIINDAAVKDKTFSCNFTDVSLQELFTFISRNIGVSFNVSENMIWVTADAANAKGYYLETRIFKLRHGIVPQVPEGIGVTGKTAFTTTKVADDDLQNALKQFFDKAPTGGTYQLFLNRNLLVVKDTRARIRELEKLLEVLDRPPQQVVIEAKFIAVSENDLRDIGVEIRKANGGRTGKEITPDNDTNGNISDFFAQFDALTKDNSPELGGLALSGVLGNRSFDMLISAIESKSSTVTLSAPRITVMNNRSARIRKGEKLYYFEEFNVQSLNKGDQGTSELLVPKGKPTNLQLGITFDVAVSIGNDLQTVMLGLKPEIITFMKWEDYTSSKNETVDKVTREYITSVRLPRTHEQGVATSVAIKSGETVVLGGMVENSRSQEVWKVPFLGDIPYIGALFRRTRVENIPTNLLIFVTATILNEKGEYVRYVPPVEVTPQDLIPLKPVDEAPAAEAAPAPAPAPEAAPAPAAEAAK